MLRPVEVKALSDYRIWLRYPDGVEGVVDLSDLAGKGVFKAWESHRVFESVRLGSSGEVEWPGVGDLCSDFLYLQISGKTPDQIFPKLKKVQVSA